jgi:hypothetical protein
MKLVKGITLITLSLITLGLLMTLSGCGKECCCPSVEVGLCEPPGHPNWFWGCGGCGTNMQIWTWDPITRFPRNPNVNATGSALIPGRPYLAKVKVNNYSNVQVRGVDVGFYWASFGWFDRGTPIGSVGVDLPPNGSKWVSGPPSMVFRETNRICLWARIFHPCDTRLRNNWCLKNLWIANIVWPLLKPFVVNFVADFQMEDRELKIEIIAPRGINARVVPRQVTEEEVDPAKLKEIKGLAKVNVKKGVPQEFSLVIENVDAQYKEGDTFDITANALQNGEVVSSFTVQCKVKAGQVQEQAQ